MKTNLSLAYGALLLLAPLTPTLAQSTWQTVDAVTPWQGRAIVADPAGNFISLAISTNSTTTPVSTIVSRSADSGVTWQTVGLIGGYALKLAAAPDGTLYASGNRSDPVSSKAFIWVSLDHGATWTLATDPSAGLSTALLSMDIQTDSTGAIYVAGWLIGGNHWIVRKGQPTANGLSWSTADNFLASSGQPEGVCVRRAAAAGQPDQVFVCGNANGLWTVRHSPDAGATWATIDSYTFGSQQWPYSVATGADGSIYVAGRVDQTTVVRKKNTTTTTTVGGWLMRKSANGGASWSNVDYVTNASPAYARSLVVDPLGRIFAVGSQATTAASWLVRASADGGATWTTTDSFLPSGYTGAQAWSAAVDALGNICVVGTVSDGTESDDAAVVRRLAAP
jgi:hypothetical protein